MRVSFALPYRCTFGQHLCLVGSVQRLGSWDVRQGVAMSWSEGDICAPRASSAWVAFRCLQAWHMLLLQAVLSATGCAQGRWTWSCTLGAARAAQPSALCAQQLQSLCPVAVHALGEGLGDCLGGRARVSGSALTPGPACLVVLPAPPGAPT